MPDGRRVHFKITDEFYLRQSGKPNKLIYLQLIEFDDRAHSVWGGKGRGREELRLAYYIIGKRGAMRGHWVWGQYATMLPAADFGRIVNRANRKGWLVVS